MLRLHIDRFWVSPYAFSSFVALEEKQLRYELVELGLDRGDQRAPAYARASLTGRVPALSHAPGEGASVFWLSESDAINAYLEEAFPPPDYTRLFPAELQERARARQLSAWVRSDLMDLREERSAYTVFYAPTDKPLSAAGRAAADRVLRVADQLISEGHPQGLFATWSLADLDFAMMLQRLVASGERVPPKVRAFVDAQWSRPSVRRWVDHPRPTYVEY